jgi:hypothetical protein
MKEDTEFVPSFPYHTEVPKVLLFGLLGFNMYNYIEVKMKILIVILPSSGSSSTESDCRPAPSAEPDCRPSS